MTYHDDRAAWRQEREHRISELLQQGLTHQEIGRELNISGPAVTQFIRRSPSLRRLIRSHTATEHLQGLRRELAAVEQEIRSMHRDARKAIRDLDEELQAMELDRQLGLR